MYARFFRWASDRLHADGVIAFVSNSSFIDARTFDGFRKTLVREFNEIRIVDLKGNARTSGERRRQEGGNIFDDQIRVGVAVWFCIRKSGTHGCRVFYESVRDYAKAEEKRDFLSVTRLRDRSFSEVRPDPAGNWIKLTANDFAELLPLVDRSGKKRSVFDLTTNGVNTARDEWVYDFDSEPLLKRMNFASDEFNREHARWRGSKVKDLNLDAMSKRLKWSEALLSNVVRAAAPKVSAAMLARAHYRPFVALHYYSDATFSDRLTSNHSVLFGEALDVRNACITISAPGTAVAFRVLGSDRVCDWHFMGDTQLYALHRFAKNGERHDNITDWALTQFRQHYQPGHGKKAEAITKEAIFHYVYAVLHDPLYRETYART